MRRPPPRTTASFDSQAVARCDRVGRRSGPHTARSRSSGSTVAAAESAVGPSPRSTREVARARSCAKMAADMPSPIACEKWTTRSTLTEGGPLFLPGRLVGRRTKTCRRHRGSTSALPPNVSRCPSVVSSARRSVVICHDSSSASTITVTKSAGLKEWREGGEGASETDASCHAKGYGRGCRLPLALRLFVSTTKRNCGCHRHS
mmetsp:Transcript_1771/g.5679  ORF Transcript_1771/g.5679 Transcript_1771/m.5679 type:complete len:204 (+) Transcript_1771:875-1486(+)